MVPVHAQNCWYVPETKLNVSHLILFSALKQLFYLILFLPYEHFSLLFNMNLFILIGGWLLYNIVLVFPYINMNPPWVYTCSQSWTHLPPSSPYHPSGSSQCTSPDHLVSCIEPGLAIHFTYNIIHVSMPFSQIIPSKPERKTVY